MRGHEALRGISDLAITRRQLLQSGSLAALTPALGTLAGLPVIDMAKADNATEPAWRHGLSLFGDLKYPADFKRFDYVNPDAPKGGTMRWIAIGTYDNFNVAVSGVKGAIAGPVASVYETLMARSMDEAGAQYAWLAESASHPEDFSWVVYRLNSKAKWHDGNPVTPDDVIFSFEQLTKNSPFYRSYYSHVVKAEKSGERDVKFTFDDP